MKLRAEDVKDWAGGLRRELLEEIDAAVKLLVAGKGKLSEEGVHEVRKSMKKVRAGVKLLRGVRGMRKMAREANGIFRDAGRPLSAVRDAEVMLATVGELLKHFGERVDTGVGKRLASALTRRRGRVRGEVFDKTRTRRSVLKAVRVGRKLVRGRKPPRVEVDDLLEEVAAAYRVARKSFADAEKADDVEAFHEARKRAKDLRYALELCAEIYPSLVPMADATHELTNSLGTDHDLAVLRDMLRDGEEVKLEDVQKSRVIALIDERRKELLQQSREIGVGLFAEKAKAFEKRLRAVHGGLERAGALP